MFFFLFYFFFFNDTATTEIYTLSLHDALPISSSVRAPASSSSITSSERRSRISPGSSTSSWPAAPAGRFARPPGSLRDPPALPIKSMSVFVDMTLLFRHAYTGGRTLPDRLGGLIHEYRVVL